MAIFDDIIVKNHLDNFKGYTGNPPTTEEEYNDLDCWKDKTIKPSWEVLSKEIETETVKNKRSEEYPKIADQLDMLWHMMNDGSIPGKGSIWYESVLEIKNKYKKP